MGYLVDCYWFDWCDVYLGICICIKKSARVRELILTFVILQRSLEIILKKYYYPLNFIIWSINKILYVIPNESIIQIQRSIKWYGKCIYGKRKKTSIKDQYDYSWHKIENDEKFVDSLPSKYHLLPQASWWFLVARGIFTSNYSYNLPCSGNNHEKSYNSHNSLRQYDFQFTDFQQLLQLMFNGIRNGQRSFRQFFSNYRRKQYIQSFYNALPLLSSSSYLLLLFATLFKKKANILSTSLMKY